MRGTPEEVTPAQRRRPGGAAHDGVRIVEAVVRPDQPPGDDGGRPDGDDARLVDDHRDADHRRPDDDRSPGADSRAGHLDDELFVG